MIDEKIGVGIIGTGAIVAHHIKSINEIPQCELIALASSTKERAKKANIDFGVKVYPDYNQLLENDKIQAVIICTQSGNHLKPAIASAQAGKHILVEKPIEINVERAQQIIKECKIHSVKLSCIFQNRFSSDFIKLKTAVNEGIFGKLILGNAIVQWYRTNEYYTSSNWKGTLSGDGGAALINQGIHTIDLLLNVMGEVHSVFGKIKTTSHKIEGEDLGLGLLTFKNGALGHVQASTALYPGLPERLEIFGDQGSAILEAGKIVHWNTKDDNYKIESSSNKTPSGASNPLDINHQLHKIQIQHFVQSIIKNIEPPVSGEEGLKAIKLIQNIYESSRRGIEIFS